MLRSGFEKAAVEGGENHVRLDAEDFPARMSSRKPVITAKVTISAATPSATLPVAIQPMSQPHAPGRWLSEVTAEPR